MARRCTVCVHPKRVNIEVSIAEGRSLRQVATDYGVDKQAIARHRDTHVKRDVQAARATVGDKVTQIESARRGETVLTRIETLLTKADTLLQDAQSEGKLMTAVAAIGEVRQCLALLGKLTGELDERPTTNVLITSPDWLGLRSRLVLALRPYPEAMGAVMAALGDGGPEGIAA